MSETHTPRHPRHDEIVAAIRSNPIVGRGTGSVIDECYTDDELVAKFGFRTDWMTDKVSRRSVAQSVAAARRTHSIFHDVADDVARA